MHICTHHHLNHHRRHLKERKPSSCLDAICAAAVLYKIQALPRSFDFPPANCKYFCLMMLLLTKMMMRMVMLMIMMMAMVAILTMMVKEGNDVCVLSLILARGGELCLLLQPLELQPACCPSLASNFPKNVCL